MVASLRNCLVNNVSMLLRRFRRSLQIKKIIANAPRVLKFAEQPAKMYQSITEKRLVTRAPPTQLNKLQKLHRKRSNNVPLVNFIHSGSEITTQVGYSFRTKSLKSKATFLREEHFLKSHAADHQISTRTLQLYLSSKVFTIPCLFCLCGGEQNTIPLAF